VTEFFRVTNPINGDERTTCLACGVVSAIHNTNDEAFIQKFHEEHAHGPAERLKFKIRDDLVEGLQRFTNEMRKQMVAFIENVVSKMAPTVLPFVRPEDIVVSSDPEDPTRIRVRMPVDASTLARMAWERYEDGKTHVEVTEWLQQACPEYRQLLMLTEVSFSDGSKETRWIAKGRFIYGEFSMAEKVDEGT
jgi:hypothetical protein